MKKLRILLPIALTLVAVIIVTATVAFAEPDSETETNSKIEPIQTIFQKIKRDEQLTNEQADRKREGRLNMKTKLKGHPRGKPSLENIKLRLDAAVKEGKLTQQQADEKMETLLNKAPSFR